MADKDESTAKVLTSCVMAFGESPLIVENFLRLVSTLTLEKDTIEDATKMLESMLEESPPDISSPRFLLGVELLSIVCDEKKFRTHFGINGVLDGYSRCIIENIRYKDALPFSSGEYELALDFAHFLAVTDSSDSAKTVNDLVRAIVAEAPDEVLDAKLVQLDSTDFLEARKEDRAKFYDIFVIEYLKRFYGMNKVIEQLRERKELTKTVRIDTSGRRYSNMEETKLWKMLNDNCEITDPTQDQHLRRQLMTAELVRRHGEDNVVKDWFEENFPQLVRN